MLSIPKHPQVVRPWVRQQWIILTEDKISQEDYITLLNASRHEKFIKICLEILAEGSYRDEFVIDTVVWKKKTTIPLQPIDFILSDMLLIIPFSAPEDAM